MRSYLSPLRVRIFFFLFVGFALLLVAKLYFLQIVSGEQYSVRADRQYVRPTTSLLERGDIYFTTKRGDVVTAAHQEVGYSIDLNPQLLEDPQKALQELRRLFLPLDIPLDEPVFLAKAAKKNDPFEEFAKKVPLALGEQVNALDIPGLMAHKQKWRAYPNEALAAHTLGFVAFNKGDELAGRYGLERQYESILKRDDQQLYTNFFAEIFSDIKHTVAGDEGMRGDVVTSIEPTVQAYLEQVLEKTNAQWDSSYTGGIVIEPKTGNVVAMALRPTFNPNTFQNEKNTGIYGNRLVEAVYEMGSIIKPLTVAAGLDSGVITARTTYDDPGTMTFDGKKISNFDGRARGVVDMQQVLNQSLNTGVAFIEQRMGNDAFTRYMKSYGLNQKTGIDLPNEAAPLVGNLDTPRDIEHVTAAFGQGIAMTPIATARALSVLANGGVLVRPRIAQEIKLTNGLTKKIADDTESVRVLKKETTDEISRMLVEVVDTALRNGKIKQEHYSIAAKTGTAQIANPAGGGYYEDRYLHSFFGYFPAYDARYLVFLYTYYPKGVQYASETLTESFIDIAKYLINYYEIPPDR